MKPSSGMSTCPNHSKTFGIVPLALIFLLVCTLFISSVSPWNWWDMNMGFGRMKYATTTRLVNGCNLFRGNWIPKVTGPHYINASRCLVDDRQNCMKFGRPDTEFLKWRWKPNDCELPLFNATLFLELVRGKSMAFIGDSLARNQMQSLFCLLSSAEYPMDVTNSPDGRFRKWYFAEYNFTLAVFWSVHLVKSEDADTNIYPLTSKTLYLDQVDAIWASKIENFDYVIISAGQWFLRPLVYYQNGKLVDCSACRRKGITSLSMYYGYKMAFRTSFKTLLDLENFHGTIFLRTFSPQHYENGEWDNGGTCFRTNPIGKQEIRVEPYFMKLYWTQIAEFEAAEKIGRKRGLKFWIIDPTEMMGMRPDGHPNHYGHGPNANTTNADCVHWCLPGPIDAWNEILLQMLR